jgi:mRNA-degrading endonuclease toxin of MazEF toxin-antitoxin module
LEESSYDKRSNRQFKSFTELQRSLEKTGEDLALLVYPSLKFGTFYHIPDIDSGFGRCGDHDKHPWVVITPYDPQRPMITACPRTSSKRQADRAGELFIPGGILEELERDGVVILRKSRSFPAKNFRYYDYIGLLPEAWQDKLKHALQQWGEKITRESEAP